MSYRSKFPKDMNEIRASYPPEWNKVDILDSRFASIESRAKNVTSQFGEDGLIEAIFEIIGVKYKNCFEIGASDGLFFSNTKALRDKGWKSALVEVDQEDFRAACVNTKDEKDTDVLHCGISEKNGVDWLFKDGDCDLGSIDTDGDDIGHWRRMEKMRPRVMIIECAERGLVSAQASPDALTALAKEKKYTPIACTFCNMIFIADEEIPQALALPAKEELPKFYPPTKIGACMSRPREGPLDTMDCVWKFCNEFGIPLSAYGGPFWEMGLQDAMEGSLKIDSDILVVFDYDSFFTPEEAREMFHTFMQHPEMDALAAMQPQRQSGILMMGFENCRDGASVEIKVGGPVKVDTAHFGFTLIRLSKLKNIPKPWLMSVPNADGSWDRKKADTQRMDSDIYFWRKWKAAGNNCYVHTGVHLGHLERLISKYHITQNPDGSLKGETVHFYINDYLNGNLNNPVKTMRFEKSEEPKMDYDASAVYDISKEEYPNDKYPQLFSQEGSHCLGHNDGDVSGSKFANVDCEVKK